jgi:hypothetical protein
MSDENNTESLDLLTFDLFPSRRIFDDQGELEENETKLLDLCTFDHFAPQGTFWRFEGGPDEKSI